MRYEKVVVVMTVRFESFREMFQFLNDEKGQVYVDGENETDDIAAVTSPNKDGVRAYFTHKPSGNYEEESIGIIAEGILPDLSNVDEESLGGIFDLEAFRGEITIDGSRM